ncbi:MAG: hypothetical protein MZW92_10435 [Comamonadaceae bacterium]|nr:hypothetical protein [Comamonadaceae bacterium]
MTQAALAAPGVRFDARPRRADRSGLPAGRDASGSGSSSSSARKTWSTD